jgi:hypothetical protein
MQGIVQLARLQALDPLVNSWKTNEQAQMLKCWPLGCLSNELQRFVV